MKKSFQRVIATLNLFQGKQSLAIFLLAAIFALSACDDSSSASSNGPDENAAVDSSSSICKDCDDESSSSAKKIESSAEEAGSSSRTTSSKSSSSGKTAFSGLSDSGASSSSIEKKSSTSTEDMACSKEGYIKSVWDRASQSWVDYICSNNYYIPASEYVPSSSSKYPVMDSVFNSKLSYGEFKDPRDNQVYKTRIASLSTGESFEYFAQNLNYGKVIKIGEHNSDADTVKYCYDDDDWYCENYFGGMYTWAEAMGFPNDCNYATTGSANCPNKLNLDMSHYNNTNKYQYVWKHAQHQGICPDEWHIMNLEEYWALFTKPSNQYYDDVSVIYRHLGAENKTGMSVLLGGGGSLQKKKYYMFGEYTFFVLPTEGLFYADEHAYEPMDSVYTSYDFAKIDNARGMGQKKDELAYVRCARNYVKN